MAGHRFVARCTSTEETHDSWVKKRIRPQRAAGHKYDATSIKVLGGIEAVRKRPAMYIGSTGEMGLHHLVWEVADNSVDEAMAGYCDEINVAVHEDNSVTVIDNGRGIPVDMHATEKKPAAEVVMTVLHAGGKFDSDTYKVSGGLHGVGVSVVNALSDWLELEIWRDGEVWEQTYEKGIPTSKLKASGKTRKTGTKITFHADPSIFTTTDYSFDTLSQRLRELAFLNKGLKITLDDERSGKKAEFRFTGGIAEFVKHLNRGKQTSSRFARFTWKASGTRSKSKSRCNTTTATPKTFLPSPTPSTPSTAARTFPASAPRSPARSTITPTPPACSRSRRTKSPSMATTCAKAWSPWSP